MSSNIASKAPSETTKEKITASLNRLRDVRCKANSLMNRLMNGDEVDQEVVGDNFSSSAVFMRLWESLPDTLIEITDDLNSIFKELEDKLLN